MWKKISSNLTTALLAALVLLLIVLIFVSAIVVMIYWRSSGLRVEKITEKQVYVESSAAKTALETFRQSVVTILPREAVSTVPLLPEALQTICHSDTWNCGSMAVVLTSDGMAVTSFDFVNRPVEQMLALDHQGRLYDLQIWSRFEGYTLLRLFRAGDGGQLTEKREGYINLRPVNLTAGRTLGAAQRLMVLKESLAAWEKVGETIITSLARNDLFLTRVGADTLPVVLEIDDDSLVDGELIFDLGGGLVALVLKDGKLLGSDQIAALLQRIAQKTDDPSALDWGLNCLLLDKAMAEGLGLDTDYGCLITDGIDANYQLSGGGLAKGGAAERLGLRSGDLLLEIDGRSLLDIGPLEVMSAKAHGESIQLTVWRDERKIELNGVL